MTEMRPGIADAIANATRNEIDAQVLVLMWTPVPVQALPPLAGYH